MPFAKTSYPCTFWSAPLQDCKRHKEHIENTKVIEAGSNLGGCQVPSRSCQVPNSCHNEASATVSASCQHIDISTDSCQQGDCESGTASCRRSDVIAAVNSCQNGVCRAAFHTMEQLLHHEMLLHTNPPLGNKRLLKLRWDLNKENLTFFANVFLFLLYFFLKLRSSHATYSWLGLCCLYYQYSFCLKTLSGQT